MRGSGPLAYVGNNVSWLVLTLMFPAFAAGCSFCAARGWYLSLAFGLFGCSIVLCASVLFEFRFSRVYHRIGLALLNRLGSRRLASERLYGIVIRMSVRECAVVWGGLIALVYAAFWKAFLSSGGAQVVIERLELGTWVPDIILSLFYVGAWYRNSQAYYYASIENAIF